MTSRAALPVQLMALTLGAVLVATGCGTSTGTPSAAPSTAATVAATPSPVATPSPTPSPTPVPTAAPTPTAQPSAEPSEAPDVALGIRIGAPYSLVADAQSAMYSGSLAFDIGGQHIVGWFSGRTIVRDGTQVGVLMAIQYDTLDVVTPQMLEGAARGSMATTGGKLTWTRIRGHKVGVITSGSATAAIYAKGPQIILVVGTRAKDTKPLMTSVIKAND
jgi:hypothetical protein